MTLKVGILSLGCPRNLVDSEIILGSLIKKGFKIVDHIRDCDVAIINTCSFIKEAKEESIDAILDVIELKKKGKIKKIIVAGCLPQQHKFDLVKELRDIDAFVGKLDLTDDSERLLLTPAYFSYLKIAEGCNNGCSYCVIPKIKGRFISRNPNDAVREARILNKNKDIKELNIIGQDITHYGSDLKCGTNLAKLVKLVLENTKNIKWLRLLYLHPAHISNDLINLIKDEPRICKYIDLPIQHISDRILKLMNRRTTRSEIVSLIKRIRKDIPGVAIRTSLIVGFPGETKKDFHELLDFLKEVEFERLGTFIYSREEGTRAFNFSDQIPEKVKKERFDEVMALQQNIAYNLNQSLLGKEFEVLVEEKGPRGSYTGRTYMDAPEVDGGVFVNASKLKIGDFTRVRITDAYEYDLVGEPI